jgi:hypothetical protein
MADTVRPQLEPVRLADGKHLQAVIPGLEPVSRWARQLEQERKRRAARRVVANYLQAATPGKDV